MKVFLSCLILFSCLSPVLNASGGMSFLVPKNSGQGARCRDLLVIKELAQLSAQKSADEALVFSDVLLQHNVTYGEFVALMSRAKALETATRLEVEALAAQRKKLAKQDPKLEQPNTMNDYIALSLRAKELEVRSKAEVSALRMQAVELMARDAHLWFPKSVIEHAALVTFRRDGLVEGLVFNEADSFRAFMENGGGEVFKALRLQGLEINLLGSTDLNFKAVAAIREISDQGQLTKLRLSQVDGANVTNENWAAMTELLKIKSLRKSIRFLSIGWTPAEAQMHPGVAG